MTLLIRLVDKKASQLRVRTVGGLIFLIMFFFIFVSPRSRGEKEQEQDEENECQPTGSAWSMTADGGQVRRLQVGTHLRGVQDISERCPYLNRPYLNPTRLQGSILVVFSGF